MKRIFLLIVFLVLMALGIGFAVQNPAPVQLNYYLGTVSGPLALVVMLALAAGAVLGMLAGMGMVLSEKRKAAKLRRKAELCEQELRNLRQIPIQDKH